MNQLDDIVRRAGRAPSAHNTQPWQVRVVDDETVRVGVLPSRTLPAGDPTHRDLLLGIGAWIESFAVCLHAVERSIRVLPLPGLDELGDLPGDGTEARPIVELRLQQGAEAESFTPADVRDRRVHRGALSGVPGAFDGAGLPDWLGLRELDDRVFRPLARIGGAHTFAERDVAGEVVRWLRFSPRDPAYSRDGMTDRMLVIPAPIARTAAAVMRRRRLLSVVLGIVRPIAGAVAAGRPRPARRPSRNAPTHHVLVADAEALGRPLEPRDVVAAGRAMQRLWLHAHRGGVSVAPHSELIDAPRSHAALRRRLGLGDGRTALAVFSAGRAAAPAARSPRLTDAA